MKNNNRGTAIIEFVIVMPLFFLMLFGMLYGGIMLHDYNGLNELTRAAARAGAIEQTDDGNKVDEGNTKKVARVKRFITDNGNNYLLLYAVAKIEVKDTEKINELLKEMRTNGELHKILVKHMGEEATNQYEAAIKDLEIAKL